MSGEGTWQPTQADDVIPELLLQCGHRHPYRIPQPRPLEVPERVILSCMADKGHSGPHIAGWGTFYVTWEA